MPDVVVGLSGGVDSAVCASLLLEQGYNVTGVYLSASAKGTFANNGTEDAATAAETLGIPLVTVDITDEMERHVISAFQNAYAAGNTPNPCVLCNPAVKFRTLFSQAEKLGAMYAATGHYARAENGKLYQGDPVRDQSYMLHRLPREWIPRLLFPIGMWDKNAVREYAADKGFACASQSDSMEICFIPDGDYASFLERRGLLMPEGDFTDTEGNILGRHKGIHHYTIGQRRGLGIASDGRLYVVSLDLQSNQVVLGNEAQLMTQTAQVTNLHWLCEEAQLTAEDGLECNVRVRHSRVSYPCTFRKGVITFAQPVRKPSPGQSAVFYQNGQVLGGGEITN